MSGEVEKCPILHVRLKFDVFTLFCCLSGKGLKIDKRVFFFVSSSISTHYELSTGPLNLEVHDKIWLHIFLSRIL